MRLIVPITRSLGVVSAFFLMSAGLFPTPASAQQVSTAAQSQATGTSPLNLTAKSANIGESGIPIKISILRWSTDQERNPVVAALDPAAQAAAQAAARGRGAGGARQGRGARGGTPDPDDPAQADVDAGAQTRGGGARGGRGGRGGNAAAAAPPDPIATLTSALGKAPTVGYIWTNEVVGYSIKYAYRAALPDGGERIILATDRRLGGGRAGWKPVATGTQPEYEFTLIEARIDSKGVGEGKTSLTSKVILDNEAKTVALDNYAAAAAILVNIKR